MLCLGNAKCSRHKVKVMLRPNIIYAYKLMSESKCLADWVGWDVIGEVTFGIQGLWEIPALDVKNYRGNFSNKGSGVQN